MFRTILLIGLFYFATTQLSEIKSNLDTSETVCLNLDKIDLRFISTNDRLIAYYRTPLNSTFDQLIYEETSDLNLNFDLSPTKIYSIENRNIKTKLIKKDEQFKIFFDTFRIHIFTYDPKNDSLDSLHQSIGNGCWFDESFQFTWYCLFENQEAHNYFQTLNAFTDQILNRNEIKSLALVKLRNSNLSNWIIFDSKFAYLFQSSSYGSQHPPYGHHDRQDLQIDDLNKPKILYQSNSIYFGCAQQFCSKSTFDDLLYDPLLNQLIIYRGQYVYSIDKYNMLEGSKFSIDSYYLSNEFAKYFYSTIRVNARIKRKYPKLNSTLKESLAFFDAVELVYRDTSSYLRIHIKEDYVYIFDHLDNELINISTIVNYFPDPQPKSVDSMFYHNNHLNLLSDNYIFSYLYENGKFIFKDLKYKFKLPAKIEAALSYRDQIYFFKDDRYYLKDVENEISSFRTIGDFLFNCSKKEQPKYLNIGLKSSFPLLTQLKSFSNNSILHADDKFDKLFSLGQMLLIGIAIVFLIILLVSLFIFFEFFAKRAAYLAKSIKSKKKGQILTGNSKSLSDRVFERLIEQNMEKINLKKNTNLQQASSEL